MQRARQVTSLSNDISFMRNVVVLLSPFKTRLVFALVCTILGSGIVIINPLLSRAIVDEGIIALDFSLLLRMLGLFAVLFVVKRLLDFLEFQQFVKINKILEFRLSFNAHNHLLKLPKSYFKENNETQIIGDLRVDIGKITQLADRFMFMSFTQVFGIIGSTVGLLLIDSLMLALVLLTIPLKLVVARYFARRHEKLISKLIEYYSIFGASLGDAVSNIEVMKLWNLRRSRLVRFTREQKDIIHTEIKISYNDKMNENVDSFISFVLNVAMYMVGFWGIASSRLTIGGLFAFMTYTTQIVGPITFLTRIRHHIADIKPSLKRYIDFLNLQEEGSSGKEGVSVPDKIVFDNVSLAYEDGVPRLNDVSFELVKGQKVAIVGENGSGKSSIINLLLRLCEPSSGAIRFGDQSIADFDIDKYRGLFSVVSQDVRLFNETVRKNVDPNYTKTNDEIISTFKQWGFADLLDELPDGLDTSVGNNGGKLSGGQRQKVSAVRAMLRGAKIIVLDEATSNYDSRSEEVFNKIVNESDGFDYIIAITHQKAMLDKVDRVIHIKDGTVLQ